MIVKDGDSYVLKSKDGGKVLGKFKTRKEAEDREAEIKKFTESFEIHGDSLLLQEHAAGVWDVVLIQPGVTKDGAKLYTKEALQEATELFEGIKAYAPSFDGISDHIPTALEEAHPGGFPLAVVGWYDRVRYGKFQDGNGSEKEGLLARFHLLNNKLHEALKGAFAKGKKNLIEFSINADGFAKDVQDASGKVLKEVSKIFKATTVDLVLQGNAGGQFINLVESFNHIKEGEQMKELLKKLKESYPDFFGHIDEGSDTLAADIAKAQQKLTESLKADPDKDLENISKMIESAVNKAVEPLKAEKEAASALKESQSKLREALNAKTEKGEAVFSDEVKAKIEAQYGNVTLEESEMNKILKVEQDYQAKLQESRLNVPGQEFERTINLGNEEHDKIVKAMEGMLLGEKVEDIQPMRGLHESYRFCNPGFSGNNSLFGRNILREAAVSLAPLYEDQTTLQEIDHHRNLLRESRATSIHKLKEAQLSTSFWTEAFGDSVRRAFQKMYDRQDLDSWRKIVSDVASLPDFRTNRRIRIGGFGNLSPVSEGGTYQFLDYPTDEEVSYAATKRGNLTELTLEAMTNDDLGAVQMVVRKLPVAAAQTLKEFVFDFIADNATLDYDSTALFDATHSNLGSTALATAALDTQIIEMADQTEQDSGKVIGIKPKYLLVPNELMREAWELTMVDKSIQDGRDETVQSFFRNYAMEPIIVEYWTDANNWYLVADPALYPTIEIGFLNGQQEPELFVQNQPTIGSNFTADKITYKIRHIYGGDVLDHRSFNGSVVA